MQLVRAAAASLGQGSDTLQRNAVFDLLENASRKDGRLQPATLLDQAQWFNSIGGDNVLLDDHAQDTSPAWSLPSQAAMAQMQVESFPTANAPADQLSMDPSTIAPTALDAPGSIEDGDIFQELAMLEPTDSSNHFMQNLGFGPDLDLQEFFGDIYQPSDPLLGSMQASNQFDNYQNT